MPSKTTRYRSPPTLRVMAEEAANTEHARRLAELDTLAPLLARLDEHMTALRGLGLELYADQIRLDHHYRNSDRSRAKVLALRTGGVFGNPTAASKWLAALLSLGFVEVERTGSVYPQALLRQGHLLLRVDVPPAPQPVSTAWTFEPSAAPALSVRETIAAQQAATPEQVPA